MQQRTKRRGRLRRVQFTDVTPWRLLQSCTVSCKGFNTPAWKVGLLCCVSTQPSTLRGTVNEYQLSGWVIIINGDGGCRWKKSVNWSWIAVKWVWWDGTTDCGLHNCQLTNKTTILTTNTGTWYHRHLLHVYHSLFTSEHRHTSVASFAVENILFKINLFQHILPFNYPSTFIHLHSSVFFDFSVVLSNRTVRVNALVIWSKCVELRCT